MLRTNSRQFVPEVSDLFYRVRSEEISNERVLLYCCIVTIYKSSMSYSVLNIIRNMYYTSILLCTVHIVFLPPPSIHPSLSPASLPTYGVHVPIYQPHPQPHCERSIKNKIPLLPSLPMFAFSFPLSPSPFLRNIYFLISLPRSASDSIHPSIHPPSVQYGHKVLYSAVHT